MIEILERDRKAGEGLERIRIQDQFNRLFVTGAMLFSVLLGPG